MKRCWRCKQEKAVGDFGRDRSRGDGLNAKCRSCVAEMGRDYANRNRDRLDAYKAAWNKRNPDKVRGYALRYYHANPEAAKAARLRATADGRAAAYSKKWRQANQEKVAAYSRMYRRARPGRNRGAVGRVTVAQLESRIAFYGGKCWMCGAPWEHIDHVIPLARGGPHLASNLRPACANCNRHKRDLRLHQAWRWVDVPSGARVLSIEADELGRPVRVVMGQQPRHSPVVT